MDHVSGTLLGCMDIRVNKTLTLPSGNLEFNRLYLPSCQFSLVWGLNESGGCKSGQNIVRAHKVWPPFLCLASWRYTTRCTWLRRAHMHVYPHTCPRISVTFIYFSPRLLPFSCTALRTGESASQKWTRWTCLSDSTAIKAGWMNGYSHWVRWLSAFPLVLEFQI